jgi:hypothetical protein
MFCRAPFLDISAFFYFLRSFANILQTDLYLNSGHHRVLRVSWALTSFFLEKGVHLTMPQIIILQSFAIFV